MTIGSGWRFSRWRSSLSRDDQVHGRERRCRPTASRVNRCTLGAMAVRRLLVLGTVALALVLTSCVVPESPPPASSTTTTTYVPPSLDEPQLTWFANYCGNAGTLVPYTWKLWNKRVPMVAVEGFAPQDEEPWPTIHIDSAQASWSSVPPVFASYTLASGEVSETQPVNLLAYSEVALTITYTVVATGQTRTLISSTAVGINCAYG